MITTNAIYRCEELEDAVSVYDTIVDEDEQAAVANGTPDDVYLEIIGDETEACDQGAKPPLPKPRPQTESQEQDRDYEGLKDKNPDNVYVELLNDECQGGDRQPEAGGQVEDNKVPDQDTKTPDRGVQEHDVKSQDPGQGNDCPDKGKDNAVTEITQM